MFIHPVYAQCPVCVITVGGGLIIAKKLGIDDLLVSIWLSGLNSAIAFWLANSLKKTVFKNGYLWSLIFYSLTVAYLFYTKQYNQKIFFGLTIGLLTFFLAITLDKFLRKINKSKKLFSYQKVIIPFMLLLIITTIFKFLI